MSRTVIAKGIVAIAVLSGILKWVPSAEADAPLGRGAALESLERDAACARAEDDDAARVHLLSVDFEEMELFWQEIFRAVRRIQAQAQPGDVVQAKGLPRNTLWTIRYYLYPLRVEGVSREEGSTRRDPALEGADFVVFLGEGGVFGWRRVGS